MTSKNMKAFLDMISHSEGTYNLGDRGYNCICGGSLFNNGFLDHPRIVVDLPKLGIKSTAAGKFQILARYYDVYKKQLNLQDFSPDSQDKIAIQLIKECKATVDIENGDIKTAIQKCKSRWASLPDISTGKSDYGQRAESVDVLLAAYTKAGGTLA
jgi:muramidase (phage lysozyme)